MVRCWKCGRENEEGMRFCTNCGTPVTAGGQASGGQSGAGSSGGYDPNSETISFNAPPQTAVGFGAPTTPYTAPPFTEPAAATPPPAKSKTGLIVGVIAGVLLLGVLSVAAIGGYYYYSNSRDVAVNNGNNSNRQGGLDPDKKATPEANTNASPESSPEASPTPRQQLFEPPTTPTKEGSFTVYANEAWQMSNIAVVPLEQFTTTVDGIVDISGVKTGVRAGGVSDAKFKSRRLFPEFPVGALIMRTRYADGRFSNMVAMGARGDWQNLPDERGMLEFIINDNAPQDNGGQFTIKVRFRSVPKK
ncbi:MAG TPA: zinc ribbon domain-containing protein [Pyrinomonadaceae bacterium]|nr:zinc ribbon domain-containing protein [Pyrinomonadaceae bacterium]